MASVRARIATAYQLRYSAMAVLLIGLASWFLYDGYVSYPAQASLRAQYELHIQQHGASTWPEYARSNGLPDGTYGEPGKPYTSKEIFVQKLLGFVTLPFGLILLVAYVRTLGRWVEADEIGLATNQVERVPYASVTRLDRRRWKRKGIAVVSFDDGGRMGTIVLDDWKYDREATVSIFNYLEAQLAPEKIVDIKEGDSVSKPA
jgi:hypothetical protein